MLSSIRAAVVLSIFSAVPLLAGCPDPEGRFNEYVGRIPDGKIVVMYDAPPLNEIPDISGNNLLAIKIVFVGSGPLQALVNVTMTKTGATAKANFHISWLDKESLQVTGTPFDVNDIQISSAGEFDVNIATLMIPAAANPLGIDAVAKDTVLHGLIKSADFFCGTVNGMVTSPTMQSLQGSTFGAVRVTNLSQLPTPVTLCP